MYFLNLQHQTESSLKWTELAKKRDFSFRTQIKICDLKIQSNHKLESKKSGPAKNKGLPGSVSCRS